MRAVFVIFTVLAVIAATVHADLIVACRGTTDPDYVEYVPHPCSCDTYYICNGTEPVPMPCPNGLFWNNLKSICDLPGFANCIVHPKC
nr:peritrophin-1-like [Megalopta genalis]